MKKIKPFSRYKYISILELHDENDHETYNLIKEILQENGTEELIKGVFITNKENAIVELMVNFQNIKRYQGLNKAIKTSKILHVADISDMMPLLNND